MKRKSWLLFPVILFCLSGPVRATTYTVKAGGGGNFTTIQACANAAVAGDTCIVFAGTYPEYVSVPTSGTAGNPITFEVNSGDSASMQGFSISSKNYITIGGGSASTGFEITDQTLSYNGCVYLSSTNHVTIQYNYIHQCSYQEAIRMNASTPISTYTVIKGNTIAWPAAVPYTSGNGAAGVAIDGDYSLMAGNDISHVTDFVHVYGSYEVIRNNTFHDVRLTDFPSTTNSLHVDGIETDCSAPDHALVHALYENNTLTNNLVPNGHGWLLQDQGACGSHGVIIRENAILNIGSYYLIDNSGGLSAVKDYNNTVVNAESAFAPKDCGPLGFAASSINGAVINDLLYNDANNTCDWYDVAANSTTGFVGKNNLAYLTACTTSCTFRTSNGFGMGQTGVGNITNQDPLLVDPTSNLHLQSGSPARATGTYLTTVASTDTGSGTSLVLNDAGFFQDGSGIVNADWIRVGSSNTVRISSVNYTTNTITLANGISRSVNDPVYLYQDSNGTVVLLGANPDIGAYQYGPPPPTNLTAVPH